MKVRSLLYTGLLLVGCGSVNENKEDGGVGQDSGSNADAGVDMEIDAPPAACTETTCTNGTLEVCGSGGMVESTQQCGLGCFADGTRCNAIVASNGLSTSVDQAAQQGEVTLPDGSQINTDTGTVSSVAGTIAVATTTVAQSGGATLRVLIAKSFTLGNVRVTGTLPLALVASNEIKVQGVLDVSADGSSAGAGAGTCAAGNGGAPGSGFFSTIPANNTGGYPHYLWTINGGGGGGFGTAGGNGGQVTSSFNVGAGGAANGEPTLVPLRGGCAGYSDVVANRGAGGGAVQLVANERIHLVSAGGNRGVIDVGGGGGKAGALGREDLNSTDPVFSAAGGGSGGAVLLEAAVVVIDDGAGLLAGGGGGGGYGACTPAPNGADATPSGTAGGGSCAAARPAANGGAGATTASGAIGGNSNATQGGAGGGGGGLGRIRINTRDGAVMTAGTSVLRGDRTTGTAGVR
ncbi:MAG: hypothetical protein AB7T06_19605 [Kofleriaceae bacterium]